MAVIPAALAAVSGGTSLLIAAGMALSRWGPVRFWPPGDRDWRWATYFGLGGVATAALVAVGYADWNEFVFPRPISLVAGAGLIAVGAIGFVAATLDLGVRETEGLEGELRTGGAYRYTRNPQVVCGLLGVGGAPLLTNSGLVLVGASAMACWFVLMPLAEEPWLRRHYGAEYGAYCRTVPRFLGPTTVERLLADLRRTRTASDSDR